MSRRRLGLWQIASHIGSHGVAVQLSCGGFLLNDKHGRGNRSTQWSSSMIYKLVLDDMERGYSVHYPELLN
jgi:hypothetical protein